MDLQASGLPRPRLGGGEPHGPTAWDQSGQVVNHQSPPYGDPTPGYTPYANKKELVPSNNKNRHG
eukprot:7678899-Karenia_brevis.AAC.1